MLTPPFRESCALFRAAAKSIWNYDHVFVYIYILHIIVVFRPFATLSPPFRDLSPLQQKTYIHICKCHSGTKSLTWVLARLPYIYIYIYIYIIIFLIISNNYDIIDIIVIFLLYSIYIIFIYLIDAAVSCDCFWVKDFMNFTSNGFTIWGDSSCGQWPMPVEEGGSEDQTWIVHLPFGNDQHSYLKLPFIMNCPIKNGDFPCYANIYQRVSEYQSLEGAKLQGFPTSRQPW